MVSVEIKKPYKQINIAPSGSARGDLSQGVALCQDVSQPGFTLPHLLLQHLCLPLQGCHFPQIHARRSRLEGAYGVSKRVHKSLISTHPFHLHRRRSPGSRFQKLPESCSHTINLHFFPRQGRHKLQIGDWWPCSTTDFCKATHLQLITLPRKLAGGRRYRSQAYRHNWSSNHPLSMKYYPKFHLFRSHGCTTSTLRLLSPMS